MLQTNFVPFPEIKTKRLFLRKVNEHDLHQILLLRSNNDVMKYLDKKKAKDLNDAKDFLKMIDDSLDTGDGVLWGIELKKKPGLLVGYICYWRLVKEHYRAEVGYMLLPEFWNKGLMKEALSEVIIFGYNIMKLHSIEARINPRNKASASLLLSTGFIKEAYFKEDFYYDGKFGDTEVYSRLEYNNS
ncbi:MAG TPA: GNAT family N-acetyltransferase [Chitinophagaceae bacterium]|nr:GNAT family N-acetyltransferase [Chitinophagaceae bacterium]